MADVYASTYFKMSVSKEMADIVQHTIEKWCDENGKEGAINLWATSDKKSYVDWSGCPPTVVLAPEDVQKMYKRAALEDYIRNILDGDSPYEARRRASLCSDVYLMRDPMDCSKKELVFIPLCRLIHNITGATPVVMWELYTTDGAGEVDEPYRRVILGGVDKESPFDFSPVLFDLVHAMFHLDPTHNYEEIKERIKPLPTELVITLEDLQHILEDEELRLGLSDRILHIYDPTKVPKEE